MVHLSTGFTPNEARKPENELTGLSKYDSQGKTQQKIPRYKYW
jgi:hypothetical protein